MHWKIPISLYWMFFPSLQRACREVSTPSSPHWQDPVFSLSVSSKVFVSATQWPSYDLSLLMIQKMPVLIDFPLGFSAYTPDTFLSSILMSIFLLQKVHYKERPLTTPQKQLLHKGPFKSQQKRSEMGSLVNSKCKLWEKGRKIVSMQLNIYIISLENLFSMHVGTFPKILISKKC